MAGSEKQGNNGEDSGQMQSQDVSTLAEKLIAENGLTAADFPELHGRCLEVKPSFVAHLRNRLGEEALDWCALDIDLKKAVVKCFSDVFKGSDTDYAEGLESILENPEIKPELRRALTKMKVLRLLEAGLGNAPAAKIEANESAAEAEAEPVFVTAWEEQKSKGYF